MDGKVNKVIHTSSARDTKVRQREIIACAVCWEILMSQRLAACVSPMLLLWGWLCHGWVGQFAAPDELCCLSTVGTNRGSPLGTETENAKAVLPGPTKCIQGHSHTHAHKHINVHAYDHVHGHVCAFIHVHTHIVTVHMHT